MVNIYLNYSSRDLGYAISLYQGLSKRPDFNVFFDRALVRPGESFERISRPFMDRADIVLVAIGPNWQPGNNIQEILEALENDKPVLPVLMDDISFPGRNSVYTDEINRMIKRLGDRTAARYRYMSFQDDLATIENRINDLVSSTGNMRALLYAGNFSSQFTEMFMRMAHPNIMQSSDMMMFYSQSDWDERQIQNFSRVMNRIVYHVIQAGDWQGQLPVNITPETRFLRVRSFSRPASIQVILEMIITSPVTQQIVAGIVTHLIIHANKDRIKRGYRMVVQLIPGLRRLISAENMPDDVYLMPDGSGYASETANEDRTYNIADIQNSISDEEEVYLDEFYSEFMQNRKMTGFRMGGVAQFGMEYIDDNL